MEVQNAHDVFKHELWKVFFYGSITILDGDDEMMGNQGFCASLWPFCEYSTCTHSILWGCEKCLGCTLWCAQSENNSK